MKTRNQAAPALNRPAPENSASAFVPRRCAPPKAFLLYAILAFSTPLLAQTNLLKMDWEWADSIGGPWTKPPSSETYVTPSGSLLTMTTEQKFFRVNVESIDYDDIEKPEVLVVDLLPATREIAESHLQLLISNFFDFGSEAPGGNTWTNARLGPVAFKVFDPCYMNGEEPAYVEFKIVSDFQPAEKPAEFLVGNEAPPVCDLGHILVSLHEGDAPVPEFNTEGSTPCEELLRRVGHVPGMKIMRFGPAFATVENEQGEMLANAGADPFRLPDNLFNYDQTHSGEFDSETAEEPPADGWGGPRLQPGYYSSYAEFKDDYVNNPNYQELRRRRAAAAATEWMLFRGEMLPELPVVSVEIGQWIHAFESQPVRRYFLDDDEGEEVPLATIDDNTGGDGLAIRGDRLGMAPFTVQIGESVTQYYLHVTPAGAAGIVSAAGGFTPGWQPAKIWNKAGGWGEQVRYYQTKDGDWCSKVGCGPVAWAMLLAWWDRHGVPAAFYSSLPGDLNISDAPKYISQAPSKIHTVYDNLHEYCDVICAPNGAGATPPGDMVEGGLTYLWIPKILNKVGYSYAYSWDLMDPDWNQPSSLVRTSVKNGRPAVIGLGWLWHYAVAYAYLYQEYKVHPDIPPLVVKRYFRCNEGWGKSSGAWYSGYDTFLGMTIKPYQK